VDFRVMATARAAAAATTAQMKFSGVDVKEEGRPLFHAFFQEDCLLQKMLPVGIEPTTLAFRCDKHIRTI
jgi:hypothetical protein